MSILALSLTLLVGAPVAPRTPAYGIAVGGSGQGPLRFADRDAERLPAALVEVAGYAPEHVDLLRQPSKGEVLAALERVSAVLERHERRGEPTSFVFYYSGHARAA